MTAVAVQPAPRNPAPAPARLTVVEQLYHEAAGAPTPCGHQFCRQLSADEQTYQRSLRVGAEWQPLDRGWVASAGMLHLVNHAGEFRGVQPTDLERQESAARLVEVAFGDDPQARLVVRPGESCRFEPCDAGSVRLRCRGGEARCVLTLVPA